MRSRGLSRGAAARGLHPQGMTGKDAGGAGRCQVPVIYNMGVPELCLGAGVAGDARGRNTELQQALSEGSLIAGHIHSAGFTLKRWAPAGRCAARW